ncbi:MAG: hydrogenase accessory protein HypB, partial [Candidatus Coatesbacteria bacterium RBG_13_66_14]
MEIKLVRKVLEAHEALAGEIRADLARRRIYCINVMSSPGAGKTTLLERTLASLSGELRAGVIEGDITTTRDAERIARHGIPVVQVNTEPFGGDCHVGANFVKSALGELPLEELDLVIIENVGNLVCPAEFDLGEDDKVVVFSITEGEDKPLKYPLMFRESSACVVNKLDLAPHLDVDLAALRANVEQVNPKLAVFELSAKTGRGLSAWLDWL